MNRRDIYNKYDGHCAYCGKKIEFDDMTIDHIVPSSKGGANTLDNTIPSCQLCNNQKADRSVESRFYAFAPSAPAALQLESTSRVLSSCSFIENITETLDVKKCLDLAFRATSLAGRRIGCCTEQRAISFGSPIQESCAGEADSCEILL